ncbi:MAG: superoxide dismutase [Candidatus Kapaibacterium sp.]
MQNRRQFLTAAGAMAVATAASGAFPEPASAQDKSGGYANHKLPPLPYDYNALEPVIDETTLRTHHDIHHQGYVNGLNNAEEQLAIARVKGDFSMVDYWSQKSAFHGGGHTLHSLYWKSMSPDGGGMPTGKIAEAISKSFGTFDKFKQQFSAAAKSVEGSGWAILAARPGDDTLLVFQVENHQKQIPPNIMPIMAIDVWEHAYYLKYMNKRGDYVDKWWDIANWEQAEQCMMRHKK